ncbi:hypothetical protein V1512DRAFT_254756 [Lipomyces arxii]|uniref:uncharacterized protein n=1 Tax=Lipomyces arxii TaxID=56418 RepID=UPI0034CFE9D0
MLSSAVFSGSFWTPDYKTGLDVLYNKLFQEFEENREIINLMTQLAHAEKAYSVSLQNSEGSLQPSAKGFKHDRGATLRQAYEGLVYQISDKAKAHAQICESVKEQAIRPLKKFLNGHEEEVTRLHQYALGNLKNFEKLKIETDNAEKVWITKSNALARYLKQSSVEANQEISAEKQQQGSDEKTRNSAASPSGSKNSLPRFDVDYDTDADIMYSIGGAEYNRQQVGVLLGDMIRSIPRGDQKQSIIGTYRDCSSGDSITHWILNKTNARTVAAAEEFGQDLVDSGFLRFVLGLGNEFLNSSKKFYQWQKEAFVLAGLRPTLVSRESIGGIQETLLNFVNGNGEQRPEESTKKRLERELKEAEVRYRVLIRNLDIVRCTLEEILMNQFRLVKGHEIQRIEVIKYHLNLLAGILDNSVVRMRHFTDVVVKLQESISPEYDLRSMNEEYQTGFFAPQVKYYKTSYKRNNLEQFYGVPLSIRLNDEERPIPYIVVAILKHLDQRYVGLKDDTERENVWINYVSLTDIHKLRQELNEVSWSVRGPESGAIKDLLESYSPLVIANALKLYFLELPDSLVGAKQYDTLKEYYHQRSSDVDKRINDNESLLAPLVTILEKVDDHSLNTLHDLLAHLSNFLKTLSASENYTRELAHEFARIIHRPKLQSRETVGDTHPYRLVLDLLHHTDYIFKEFKERRKNEVSGRQRQPKSMPATPPVNGVEESTLRLPSPQPMNLTLTPSSRNRLPIASSVATTQPEFLSAELIEHQIDNSEPVDSDVQVLTDATGDDNDDEEDSNPSDKVATPVVVRHLVGEDESISTNLESRFKGVQLIDPPMDDDEDDDE